MLHTMTVAVAAVAVMTTLWGVASAQAINPQRDCQTLLKCQYAKGGSFRGCISSYSCRQCRFVPGRCGVGTAGRSCQRLQCGWGA